MKIYYNKLGKSMHVMLDLRKREQAAEGHEHELLRHQIEKIDREIDERVYELYGITEAEKRLIEN